MSATDFVYGRFKLLSQDLPRYDPHSRHRGLRSADIHEPVILLNTNKLFLHWTARIDSFVKVECGEGVCLGSYFHCASFAHLNIGGGLLIMEDGTSCGSGVKIVTGSNVPGPNRGCSAVDPNAVVERSYVHVKRNAVLFVNSVVLPGVTIGEGAVVAAGAVVTKDVGDYELWAGVPAKRVRGLERPTLPHIEVNMPMPTVRPPRQDEEAPYEDWTKAFADFYGYPI